LDLHPLRPLNVIVVRCFRMTVKQSLAI
jgi:hypothetical protein